MNSLLKKIADPHKYNQVIWRLADALGTIPQGAEKIEVDPDELMALAVERISQPKITTLEQIEELPIGSVLLASGGEVFMLWQVSRLLGRNVWAANQPGGKIWVDAQVFEVGPLTLLHRGT